MLIVGAEVGCTGQVFRRARQVLVCPADVSCVVANVGAERYFERDGERQGKK